MLLLLLRLKCQLCLIFKNYAPSTITSYVSALSYLHKLCSFYYYVLSVSSVLSSKIMLLLLLRLMCQLCLIFINYAPSTITSYVSALSYLQKLSRILCLTQHFVIKKRLAGTLKLCGKSDTHLPIGPKVLRQIIDAINFTICSAYLRNLLRGVFLLAFNEFVRIGEMTVDSGDRTDTIVQLKDVTACYYSSYSSHISF